MYPYTGQIRKTQALKHTTHYCNNLSSPHRNLTPLPPAEVNAVSIELD